MNEEKILRTETTQPAPYPPHTSNENADNATEKPKRLETANRSNKLSIWCWLSIASLVCGCITFCKGIHRMVRYENSEYSWGDHINAWVGGDAYNYIINGTHATAFFVLTMMFVLSAIGLLIVHYLAKNREEKESAAAQKTM